MNEFLANGKAKQSIFTLLMKSSQSCFEGRGISYVLPGNCTLTKHQQSVNDPEVGDTLLNFRKYSRIFSASIC